MNNDETLDCLLGLHGERFVVEELLGLWTKIEAHVSEQTKERPHGLRYSLTLHDRFNNRIMGFDNAHAIEFGRKTYVAPKRSYDHWHENSLDEGQPYYYINAATLLKDFWKKVEDIIKHMRENQP